MRQKERFEEFLHRYPLNHVRHRNHFLRGEAVTHITELARRHRISLIVMGSTYSLGLGGVFVGSTAEQILSIVRCSILTVKPEGFVTPVDTA
jgi:nucleotide-binding universal stress UspA family protein